MDTHESDGITFRYDGRNSWHDFLAAPGKREQRVAVAWAEHKPDRASGTVFLEVYFKDAAERSEYLELNEPFLVATVAGYEEEPRRFKEYRGAFRVRPIEVGDDKFSLKTEVLKRIKADDLADA